MISRTCPHTYYCRTSRLAIPWSPVIGDFHMCPHMPLSLLVFELRVPCFQPPFGFVLILFHFPYWWERLKPMNWCKTRKKQREHDNDWNTLGALVWLWNKHLGFLPFTLFDINDLVFIVQWVVVSFHFDVSQFVKSTIMPLSFPILIKVMPLLILFSLMFWCPATISSNKRSVSFIDDCTWVTWLFLMKDKVKSISTVCPVLPHETQFGKPIKCLWSVEMWSLSVEC